MIRVATAAALILVGGILPAVQPVQSSPDHPGAIDTIQAGDRRIDPARLTPFAIERRLTLTKGDSSQPFGTQAESFAPAELNGHPALLGVLVFTTPRATTVDSSWLNPATLQPIRMVSTNSARIVSLSFEGDRIHNATTPATGAGSVSEQQAGVRPFEWNSFGLALSALPLRKGFRAIMPVYMDRYDRVIWYRVEVLDETALVRSTGYHSPMWEVLATPDSAAPTARYWVSRHHRFVDQVRVSEPGVAIMYQRAI